MNPKPILTNVENYEEYPKISNSELSSLMSCTQKHDYGYRQGLKTKDSASYLSDGRYMHSFMEVAFKHLQDTDEVLTPDELTKLSMSIQVDYMTNEGITVDDTVRLHILDQMIRFWKHKPNFKVIHTEAEFFANVGLDNTLLHGIIDAVVEDEQGNKWIIDHKRAGKAWNESKFLTDPQGPLYALALKAMFDWDIKGMIYNFLYTPKKSKSDLDTRTVLTSHEKMMTWQNNLKQALKLRDSGIVMNQVSMECGWCFFKDLCMTEMEGQDGSIIRADKYEVNEEVMARFKLGAA